MKAERQRWIKIGVPALSILSAVGLFRMAGILPFASIAAWVIFLICAFGLERMYGILVDIVAAIVDAKSRQAARRRRAGTA
jgi:uncharacterized membrane protein SirB2